MIALVKAVREAIASKTGVPRENILVAASHNHSGPDFEKETNWAKEVIEKIGAAAVAASSDMRLVSVGYGEDTIGFGINRRKVINGRAVVRLNPDGPNDRRVKVLRFDDGRSLTPLAVLDARGLSPVLLHLGRQRQPPVPDGLPQNECRLPG